MSSPPLTLHYCPQSRSLGSLVLLEELGAPHELHVMNMSQGEQRKPEYLAINPMGKVPAISHGEALITEQGAIFIYLADLYAKAGLAPALDDPLRGPYLRWLVFYGSCFEPAVVDRSLQREPAPKQRSPYGSYDDVIAILAAQLAKGPYLLGERFTAADVLWGTALNWTTHFGVVPLLPAFKTYIDRVTARPAYKRAAAKEAELLAKQEAT